MFPTPKGPVGEDLRRFFRRPPGLNYGPVAPNDLLGELLPFLVGGAIFGAVINLFWDGGQSAVVLLAGQPYAHAHWAGVRHRWLALGSALVIGGGIFVALYAAFGQLLDASWASYLGCLIAFPVAVIPYGRATQMPTRLGHSPSQDGPHAES